jgi:hypothetical protein
MSARLRIDILGAFRVSASDDGSINSVSRHAQALIALLALSRDYLTAASCITSASREVHKLSIRYAASAWRFDRSAETMPEHYLGTAHEHLWHAFKSGAPMPIGERQLRTILC